MNSGTEAPPLKLQLAGALLVALLLGCLAQWLLVTQRELTSGLVVWAAAVVAFAAAMWLQSQQPPDTASTTTTDASSFSLTPRAELALFALVMTVGVFFRVYRIASIPAGLNHDAAWNGLYAIKITQGIPYSPFVDCCGAFGHETMFHYVIAALQLLIGPQQLAIEGASTIIGIATLPMFYLLVRKMFDARVALVATFLLGVSGWNITFSRAGWHAILIPFFEALVFYLLLRALDSKKAWPYLLAGIALGFSLDTYDAAKTIPLSAAVFLLFLVLRNRSFIRDNLRGLIAYGLGALVAVGPLAFYILGHWESYMGRSRALWIGTRISQAHSLHPLLDSLFNGLLIFNFKAHGDDFFTTQPLLDVPVSIFFILGLVYSLKRIKQPVHFLLLSMLLLSMTNGFLSVPNGNRGIGATLPAMVYAALFLVVAWDWLRPTLPQRATLYASGLVAVLALVGYLSFSSYLGPHRRDQWGFYPETTRVGRYMKGIAADYQIYAEAGNWPRDALTYLSYQGAGDPFARVYTYFDSASQLLVLPPSTSKGTAFIVEANGQNTAILDALGQRFPTAGKDQIFYDNRGRKQLVANVLLVPKGAVPQPYQIQPLVNPQTEQRDIQRHQDLDKIAEALGSYQDRTGSYPSTNGNLQTACVFPDLDQLCKLSNQPGNQVSVASMMDPRGDPTVYGYWYASDGKSFTVYATLEGPLPPDQTCVAKDPGLAAKPNLYCVAGSSAN